MVKRYSLKKATVFSFVTSIIVSHVSALTVDTTADELDATGAGGNTSLREAIRDTPAGGTIDFDLSLDGTTTFLTNAAGTITIGKDLTIDASALTSGINIWTLNSPFDINAGNISFNGITFVDGFSPTQGGTFKVTGGASLTLTSCKIIQSESSQGGGAIYSNASSVNLIQCTLRDNVATGNGGAVLTDGLGASLTISGCILQRNISANRGGAIHSSGNFTVALSDTSLLDNRATFGGGLSKTQGTLTLTGCVAARNFASTAGGGIYMAAGTSTCNNCTFANNKASDGGGAIALNSSHQLTLTSGTISGNNASNNGGGILVRNSTLNLGNSIVAANSAGGSTDIHSNGGTITRSGVNILGSNQSVDTDFPAGAPNINTDFVGTDAAPYDAEIAKLGYYGGPTMSMHPLAGSPAIDAGGTNVLATDQRGFSRTVGASVDIGAVETGPVFVVNTTADENDGALNVGSNSLRECVQAAITPGSRVVFAASVNGGTITLQHGLISCNAQEIFIDASAMSNGVTVNANNASGIFSNNAILATSTLALHSLTLTNGNSSALRTSTDARLCVVNCNLNNNHAVADYGGAIKLASATAMVMDTHMTDNTSGSIGGGAIHASSSELWIDRCHFGDNIATSSTEARGGAIHAINTPLYLANSSITGNNASGSLGGMGGGIHIVVPLHYTFKRIFLINNTIDGNQSTTGGGMSIDGTLGIIHCRHLTISGNAADAAGGGGVYIRKSGSNADQLIFEHCIIATNVAPFQADIDFDASGGGSAQILKPGANLIGDNSSAESIFPAGTLVGTTASPVDPMFAALADNGGPTTTRSLLAGSPAIDAGAVLDTTPMTDQRGLPRNLGTAPDLGSYETGNLVGYALWASETIPSGSDATFDGDADSDLNKNSVEYATDRIPTQVEAHDILSVVLVPKAGGGYETHITFPYEPSIPDIKYNLQRSTILNAFGIRYSYTPSTGNDKFHVSGDVTATVDADNKTITVIDDVGTDPYYFWRLMVEQLP